MKFQDNPYYYPEKSDLTLVASVDFADCYEFDIVAVWKVNETGQMYYAFDSGCSCPTPFEDYRELDDLNPLNENTLEEFKQVVNEQYSYRSYSMTPREKGNFLRSVTITLRKVQ